jgi:1-phosphatidylinositol phosphodiesterase
MTTVYHGPVSQRAHFPAILDDIYAFLASHPTESILITLKEEIPPNDPSFARMVWDAIEPGDRAGYWFRQPRVPTLGEVRGKAILMSRFAQGKEWEAGVGWVPSWPNNRKESETELTADGSVFRLQDW